MAFIYRKCFIINTIYNIFSLYFGLDHKYKTLLLINIIIILFHKPDDRDWISQLIPKEASSYVFPSYPTESLLDLAALIDNLDLIISPDTSIVHMACAFKKPLVAVYNQNIKLFEIWHPISDCNYVVFSEYEDSLKSINVEDIIKKTFKLIENINNNL